MNRIPIRLGPLALLLTVITICMTVLGVLTFSTARADLTMAEKYAATTQARYQLEKEGQALLYQLDQEPSALLGEPDEDGLYPPVALEQDGLTLTITLKKGEGGRLRVTGWQFSQQWEQNQDIGSLWPG